MDTSIDVLTVDDIAEALNVRANTVRAYIKRGDLIASKIGRSYIVTVDNFKSFIRAKEVNHRTQKVTATHS